MVQWRCILFPGLLTLALSIGRHHNPHLRVTPLYAVGWALDGYQMGMHLRSKHLPPAGAVHAPVGQVLDEG